MCIVFWLDVGVSRLLLCLCVSRTCPSSFRNRIYYIFASASPSIPSSKQQFLLFMCIGCFICVEVYAQPGASLEHFSALLLRWRCPGVMYGCSCVCSRQSYAWFSERERERMEEWRIVCRSQHTRAYLLFEIWIWMKRIESICLSCTSRGEIRMRKIKSIFSAIFLRFLCAVLRRKWKTFSVDVKEPDRRRMMSSRRCCRTQSDGCDCSRLVEFRWIPLDVRAARETESKSGRTRPHNKWPRSWGGSINTRSRNECIRWNDCMYLCLHHKHLTPSRLFFSRSISRFILNKRSGRRQSQCVVIGLLLVAAGRCRRRGKNKTCSGHQHKSSRSSGAAHPIQCNLRVHCARTQWLARASAQHSHTDIKLRIVHTPTLFRKIKPLIFNCESLAH